MVSETRREEIREVQKEYSWFYALIIGAALLCVGVWIGASLFTDKDSYGMNLFTELLGISATVLIINQIYERRNRERQREQAQREEEQKTEERKRRLVRRAGSRSNDIANSAIEQLRHDCLLIGDDGFLKGVRLAEADLRNANLRTANMQETDLWKTNLQSADLWWTELQGAFLVEAKLQDSKLMGAVLQDADLRVANLQGADLTDADLRGTDLRDTEMQGANLLNAKLHGTKLSGAIFPDGYNYIFFTEIGKFTNPEHPDFAHTLKNINSIRIELGYDILPNPET